MKDLKTYDDATAKYFDQLNIRNIPLVALDFHHEFGAALQKEDYDLKRLKVLAVLHQWDFDLNFKTKLHQDTIIVTDAKLIIVFASHNLKRMNGFTEAEILGKSPKIFQGAATNSKTSGEIREAVLQRKPFEKTVINYKKSGAVYNCHIIGLPVFNRKGQFSHYIAFEKAA